MQVFPEVPFRVSFSPIARPALGKPARFSASTGDTFQRTTPPFLEWNATTPHIFEGKQGRETFTIERAGPLNLVKEDDKRVSQLVRLLDGMRFLPLHQIRQRETSYADDDNYHLLVRDPVGTIVGSGYLSTMSYKYPQLADTGLMGYLYVHPDHQGKGLGSKLTDLRIAAAKQLGYHYLTLFTRNPKVEGVAGQPGIVTQRGFQLLGTSRGYRCYALNLEQPGVIPESRRQLFTQALGLKPLGN